MTVSVAATLNDRSQEGARTDDQESQFWHFKTGFFFLFLQVTPLLTLQIPEHTPCESVGDPVRFSSCSIPRHATIGIN